MSNTVRRNKKTRKLERDGYNPSGSIYCTHNNACEWCRRNRTFNRLKTNEEATDRMSFPMEEMLYEYDFTNEWWELEHSKWEYLSRWNREYFEDLSNDVELPETDWENYKRDMNG